MATETQAPDAVLDSTNYTTLNIGDIDEDPDSPDGAWGTWDGNGDTICRVSFPTPTGNPTTGAGLQEFRVLIRETGGTNSATWSLELWENGAQVSVLATGADPGTGGTVVNGTWDASSLGTADGSLVECALVQTAGGSGNPSVRNGIEVGAVEWNVTYDATSTFNESITVAASGQVSPAVAVTFEAGVTVSGSAGVAQGAQATFQAAAALGAVAAMVAAGNLVIPESVVLAAASGIAAQGGLAFAESISIDAVAGISAAQAIAFNEAVALAVVAGVDIDTVVSFSAAVPLQALAGLASAASAVFDADVTVAGVGGLASAGAIEGEPSAAGEFVVSIRRRRR